MPPMSATENALVILDIEGEQPDVEDKELLRHPAVGGLILFSRNFVDCKQLSELVKELRSVREDLLLCVDHEGGRVQRFREGFTVVPPMQTLGTLYLEDKKAACEAAAVLGWIMAAELLSYDIDLSFAPVLDLDKDFSTIIGDRAFSDDAAVAIELAAQFISGMNEAGMCATGKHFPGHGGVHGDSHTELPVDIRTLHDLEAHDLRPFVKLMPQLNGMMPAHIVFPEVDELPVGFSAHWLKNILKGSLGFKGVIFSDDLNMEGAAVFSGYAERAEAALNAGCDSILICNNRAGAIKIVEEVEKRRRDLSCLNLETMKKKQRRRNLHDLKRDSRYKAAQILINRLRK